MTIRVRNRLRFPENKAKLDIYPEISDGSICSVTILGDPEGLRYLAGALKALADYDQNCDNAPIGSREHIHLHGNCQLGDHSCEVELCRADAKGTGELPVFMRESPHNSHS